MNSPATFENVTCFSDARGLVIEPLGADQLPLQKNSHLVLTAPGAIRGNHYHRLGTEVFVLIGPALVRWRNVGAPDSQDNVIAPGQVVRFTIPPGVAHAIQNTGSEPLVLIAFSTHAHDPQSPDVVRDVLIPA